MSKISNIYDGLVSQMETTLSSHTRIPNPYDLTQNNEQFLTLGWGIAIEDAERTDRSMCNKIWIRRTFLIKITRLVATLEMAVDERVTAEKALLEDLKSVYNDLYSENLSIADANLIEVIPDDGVEFIKGDKFDFVSATVTVTAEYNETLT